MFLCVPTPQGDDGSADLSYVEAGGRDRSAPGPGTVIVNKSTVPVGSPRWSSGCSGAPTSGGLQPRIPAGGDGGPRQPAPGADRGRCRRPAGRGPGRRAVRGDPGAPLLITDAATAETIKYASNAFLATKLSFVNAVAGLCEAVGADVRDVILGLGYDKRIGFEFLKPGPGWGGAASRRTPGRSCTSPSRPATTSRS